jgi:tRNA G10  N-methylase Trm11
MEYMATLPDKFFDLAIVDPPYGIEKEISERGVRKDLLNLVGFTVKMGKVGIKNRNVNILLNLKELVLIKLFVEEIIFRICFRIHEGGQFLIK